MMLNPPYSGDRPRSRHRELQQALLATLEEGAPAIPQQISYALALCKTHTSSTEARPYLERVLSPEAARLLALSNMLEAFNEAQISKLLEEAERLADLETQLEVITRVALRLPPQHYLAIVTHVWEQSAGLTDLIVYTRVMFRLTPLLALLHDEPAVPAPLLEVISLAQAIGSGEARVRALISLTPYLLVNMRVRLLHRILDEIDLLHQDTQRSQAFNALADHLLPEVAERALQSAKAIQHPAERARALSALARYTPISLSPELSRAALEAIQATADEEERAEALVAFAPHLEYMTNNQHFPALLEQSLAVVVSLARRPLRARALTALAPHLSPDLQTEALAAVRELADEGERAALLAQLAPTLPPNLLLAGLAAAREMQTEDARVHALSALARYAPDHIRSQALKDALAAATDLPNPYERVIALMALVDALPDRAKVQTYGQMLEAAQFITNENARSRALSLLAPHLPPLLLAQARESASQLSTPSQFLSALMSIAPRLPPEERHIALREMLFMISQLPFEYKRARMLADLAPLLPPTLLPAAAEIAHSLTDPFDRASAYTILAQHLPLEQRRPLIAETWKLLKRIENGYDAASALASLAPLLPPSAANDLARMAGMIIGSIMDDYDQASAITLLAPIMAMQHEDMTSDVHLPDKYAALENGIRAALRLPHQRIRLQLLEEGALLWADMGDLERAYALWREVIQRIATLTYADGLLCIAALMPVIRQFTTQEDLKTIARLMETR